MRKKRIAGHELSPGKTIKGQIYAEGTELHVPHVLPGGARSGPAILISGGIHNAAYVGSRAAIALSDEVDVAALRGNVIILPLADRAGFENRIMSRVCEDEKN